MQPFQLFQKARKQRQDRKLSCTGDHIIGRLGHIYMVIGMNNRIIPLFTAQDLNRPVGYDLVSIHIGRGACASLNGVYNKLRMELSLYDLITGLYNGISNLLVQYMGRHIGISRGLFYSHQIFYKFRMQRPSCNVKILLRA